jgi:hypothetical protein
VPKPTTVAQYVASVEASMRPLFRATRAFARKHAPHATERHVNLGFTTGARVRDPDGLLEGTGKNLRHVKLRSKDDLSPALARLVARAAAAE